MLNTRTAFLNTEAPYEVMMSGVYEIYAEKVIKVFVNTLASNIKCLDDMKRFLNVEHTYCFGYYTQLNRIVRNYNQNTIFLLSITDNKSLKELHNEEIDKVTALIGAARPEDYQLKTLDAIVQAMKEIITKDPSLEGFVIKDVNGSRWKISISYFFLHHIRNDNMRTPYPKDPLILQREAQSCLVYSK